MFAGKNPSMPDGLVSYVRLGQQSTSIVTRKTGAYDYEWFIMEETRIHSDESVSDVREYCPV